MPLTPCCARAGLSAGSAYNINFWAAERPGYGAAESMRVVVDGAVVMDSSHPPEAFQQLTAVFVSQGSSATIRFENDSPDGDNSFFVDAVTVAPAPGGGAFGCEMETGDGIGGSETGIGDANSAQECVQMVRQMQPDANGATYSNTGGTGCYAEFGMTGNNGDGNWQTCLFTGAGAPTPPPTTFGFGDGEVNGCHWEIGDGTGGTEQLVGSASNGAECVSMVQQRMPNANGATYSINSQMDG